MYGWLALKVLLVVFGICWCKEVFKRFPKDVAELKRGREGYRFAIISIWVLTPPIVAAIGYALISAIASVRALFR